MFRDFFTMLANAAQDKDFRETIEALRDSQKIHEPLPGGWSHKAVQGSLNYIASVASDLGESQVYEMARDLRDEVEHYIYIDPTQ